MGPGRYVVYLRPEVTHVAAFGRQTAREHGGVLHHAFDEPGFRALAVSVPPAAAAALARHPLVARIKEEHPTFSAQAPSTQSNPPWGLDRIDQRNLPLDDAYVYGYNGSGTWVYVIDTGIRPTHNDFGGRASIGFDARPSDHRGGLPYGWDCHGHGTRVAGTAAATIHGVAKGSNVVSVRVNEECTIDMNPTDVVAGINWVRDQKLAFPSRRMVANMSLGGEIDPDVDNAVNNLLSAGVPVAVAAGNNAGNACNLSPAHLAGVMTVAASTWSDARRTASNFGSCVDIFAPGESIVSLSHHNNTDPAWASGTSMSAAHVSGVMALYLEENPSATPTAVNNTLINRATTNKLTSIGSGSPNRLLYSRPTMTTSINGPNSIIVQTDGEYHTWYAVIHSGGQAPYNYLWEVSYPKLNIGWGTVGLNQDQMTIGVDAADEEIHVRVTITSNDAAVAVPVKVTTVTSAGGGCGGRLC